MTKWPHVPLGELFELRREQVDIDPSGIYTSIGIKSFGKGLFRYPPTSGAELSKIRYFRFPDNALIASNIQAWEGAFAIPTRNDSVECIASSRFLPYVPRDTNRVDSTFALLYLLSDRGWAKVRAASPGTAVRNKTLSRDLFEAVEVPLPPLDEQRRIGALLTSVGDLLRSVQTLTDASRLRADGLRRVLIDRLCDGAPTRRIVDVLELQREPIAVEYSRVYRQIGIRSFGRGLIRYPAFPGNQLSKLRFFRFPVGALIVSNIKAWEGAIALSDSGDEGRIASNRFLPYVPRKNVEIDLRFVCAYLLSDAGLALLGAASPGSADRNRTLAIERFEQLDIPVPPLTDQLQFASAARRLGELSDAQGTSAKLRAAIVPSILNEVFSGKHSAPCAVRIRR